MSVRNYKFRLYPNPQQQKRLQNNLDVCRWVYNKFVEHVQNGFVSRNDLNYMLTELKQQESWLYNYHAKMLQMISTKLDAAQKSIIELNKKGYKVGKIGFVKYDQYRTFTYNQSGYKFEKHGSVNLLWLSKIGYIEIRKHREINGHIKQVIVSKSKSGKWHTCVTCDVDVVLPEIHLSESVGIDVGIKNFVYDSDGFVTPNPLNLKKMLKPLARIQRKIARRKIGSQNRKKAIKFYQIIHERIRNRRKDFLHKLSTKYAKKYDVVFVERLQKLNMVKNHFLVRKILDSGWGTFTNMLDYKCMLIEVTAKNTTVDCSRCGNAVPKSLAVRIHKCNICGLMLDRDHNASINILKKGLEICGADLNSNCLNIPQELREVTSVEILRVSRKQKNTIGFIRR
ncbi:RNA-guided endonuclease TnpB family protein [Candidatus Nitrosotenuis chungbukensis]|uniref:RNA-guided endonuclease InsQ/TnpB family protein n=1 Tax=Candidatus Nitrosotenuis chungbukensis TaxID=1353246 RepID=UPI002A4E1EDE|nr:RNA-guided endonuclease TnpB family protein [Candidatus Nitrosotenuis chungbukensis]